MKRVAVLGSTGSIGINTLKVIKSLPKLFKVAGISSFSNIDILEKQLREFRPHLAAVVDDKKAEDLKKRANIKGVKLLSGLDSLDIIAGSGDVDIVVIAVSGSAALKPLIKAITTKKHICLANKEAIVMAGGIVMQKAKESGARLIPVDSEHNAIFQCINSSSVSCINRIYLTGSGGPLLKTARHKFASLKIEDVLNHPKWKMGKKITVDSATLMNKGLEMIEAQHLFGMPISKITLLIHPEAVIHSMVEFIDGAVIAQLGITDMRLPIQYALTYPERIKASIGLLNFSEIKNFSFHKPDMSKYPCLSLALQAARSGGTHPAVLSAADEEAVKAFLEGRISFIKIAKVIEKVLLKHRSTQAPVLDDILQADRWAREETRSLC